ncbi:hypothetical protein GUITHDRAFT_56046, partial [Guillardia theta CCMP2712]
VRILVNGQADINYTNSRKETALHFAAQKNRMECLKILMKERPNLDIQNISDEHLRTPLHLAAQGGHGIIVEYLLQHHCKIDAADDQGQTALHKAAYADKNLVVRILLNAGADTTVKDQNGKTA